MKNIQWFPGHMTRAMRDMEAKRDLCDGVICVLDARAPIATVNKNLKKIFGEKPILYVLNKADLADPNKTDAFMKFFESRGRYAVKCDSTNISTKRVLIQKLNAITEEKRARAQAKGLNRTFRFMIAGIPNTGKSSFINRMIGTSKAKVADRPGVTKHNQWFNIGGGIELLDTPGVLWPKFDDPKVGDRLSFIGSVKDEVVDVETMAVRLIEVLAKDYTSMLTERYKLGNIDGLEDYEILELIGRKRGMLISGGEIDTERAANTLLDEYRGGKLGKITLERP